MGRRTIAAALAGVAVACAALAVLVALDNGRAHVASARLRRHRGPHLLGDVAAAARYLGMPARDVRRELRQGGTLAALASTRPGRSTTGLVEAIIGARRANLAARVAAGLLSPAVARVRLAHVREHVVAAVRRPGTP
jgi:hypothetical protein